MECPPYWQSKGEKKLVYRVPRYDQIWLALYKSRHVNIKNINFVVIDDNLVQFSWDTGNTG